jgi:hypothetical protein
MRFLRFSIKLLLFASAVAFPAQALAQTGRGLGMTSLSYIFSVPTGSTSDFLDGSLSYRGLGLEWDLPLANTDFTWGISLRWQYFRNVVEQETVSVGNATATGRSYSSVDTFPVAVHVKYPFASSDSTLVPFIGIGAGSIYGIREFSIGTISSKEIGWQFLLTPEVGLVYRPNLGRDPQVFFNVRYDHGFGTDAISGITDLAFALGIGTSL